MDGADGEAGDAVDADALYAQVTVDKAALTAHIRKTLQTRDQVTLAELVQARPLRQGLGELVAYLQLAAHSPHCVVDEGTLDTVTWAVQANDASEGDGPDTADAPSASFHVMRRAELPRVIFVRH